MVKAGHLVTRVAKRAAGTAEEPKGDRARLMAAEKAAMRDFVGDLASLSAASTFLAPLPRVPDVETRVGRGRAL